MTNPRIYNELAHWWPLLSPPSHYVEEAADIIAMLTSAIDPAPRTLLELGSGGGSLACNLKHRFITTLTDRSPQMLDVSRAVNPECEHVIGDMRSLSLGREFDAVLIHDAIMYATDADAVMETIRTAYLHCRPGGVLLILPDHVRETFTPSTHTGGEDGLDGRGLRFLEWSWDPDPTDETFETIYAIVLREADGSAHLEEDRHRCGLFARDQWLAWLREAGFAARVRRDPWERDVFIGVKSGTS